MKGPSSKLQAPKRPQAPNPKSREQRHKQGDATRGPNSREKEAANPLPGSTTSPLLFIISAPSGGGKTTLCQQLLATRNDMVRAVTCTTREPRPGEKEGVDYDFLDATTFLRRVQAGHFLEHATVHGSSYGTLRSEVFEKLRLGKNVLLNIDVQGAASIRECVERDDDLRRAFVSVFLTPSSLEILEARLKKRGQDSPAVIQKRLSVARQEIAQWKNFDYLIISTTIKEDLRRMLAIIDAEKMRQCRAKAPEF
jgi:guanylate kinase